MEHIKYYRIKDFPADFHWAAKVTVSLHKVAVA